MRILLFLLFLFPLELWAQNNVEVNEISSWFTSSENVEIPSEVKKLVRDAVAEQHIPENVMEKNMIFIKAFFNPSFDLKKKIIIANYIEQHFKDYPQVFPMALLYDYKKRWMLQLK